MTNAVQPEGSKVRVLIVEDHDDVASTMALLLRTLGYDVRHARDGAEALTTARDFLPAVVLLDIGLPDMDGYEVARRLRQEAELATTRLVALSGFDGDEPRARQAGFDHQLVKPVQFDLLREILAHAANPR
jgi:CheY-like chemotaxis protein